MELEIMLRLPAEEEEGADDGDDVEGDNPWLRFLCEILANEFSLDWAAAASERLKSSDVILRPAADDVEACLGDVPSELEEDESEKSWSKLGWTAIGSTCVVLTDFKALQISSAASTRILWFSAIFRTVSGFCMFERSIGSLRIDNATMSFCSSGCLLKIAFITSGREIFFVMQEEVEENCALEQRNFLFLRIVKNSHENFLN